MTFRPPWTLGWLLGALLSFQLAISPMLADEAPQSSTEAAPKGQASASKSEKPDPPPDPPKPQNDRIFFALPNYLTVENASSLPPQTVKEKFKLQVLSTFDFAEYPWVGMVAGIGQLSNSEPSYGQGLRGYAKRYATAFGDVMIGNFMTGAVYPSLLRQDPRYYQMGKGGFFHRSRYAASRVFITRSDSGKTQFNYSELLGNATAAGIANLYHPAPRTLANGISIWWTQIGYDALGYELKEFWPDLRRVFRRHASQPVQ